MEFSQRPATQGLAAAPPAHYHQYAPSAEDAYPGAPRRLPSLSELLVPQEPPVQQAAVAGRRSRDPASYSTHHHHYHSHAHQQMQMQMQTQRAAQAIDLPVSSAHHHQHHHRDSVSASSSVSSQDTLIDSYAAAAAKHAQPGQLAPGMCEEDVFAAASILMSLRTCKLPC